MDRSEQSYAGPWKTAGNRLKKDLVKSVLKPPNNESTGNEQSHRASFTTVLPTHSSIGGKKVSKNKSQTKKLLTAAEVEEKCQKEPSGLSKQLDEDEETPKLIHRLSFELRTLEKTPHGDLIQTLYNRILEHDPEAVIKPYSTLNFKEDITPDVRITDQCYTRKDFKIYFPDFWTTEDKAHHNNGEYSIYGKVRLETSLEWDDLKGRMTGWLQDNKYYIRKPYLQTEKVSKIGIFLGSSTAQWRQDTQKQMEEAVFNLTQTYIKMDVQKRLEKYYNAEGKQEQTPILTVQVPAEQSELATTGLSKIFSKGVLSPVGRRMNFIPTRDRSKRTRETLNRILTRQKIINVRQRQTSTDVLKDILTEVKTKSGSRMTIQQAICGIQDRNQQRIFTGAERMGKTGRVLLTFDRKMSDAAHEMARNLVEVLEHIIDEDDHVHIADESKIASRETLDQRREANCAYMETVLTEWFGYDGQEETSLSTLSGSEASQSHALVSLDSTWASSIRSVSSTDSTPTNSSTVTPETASFNRKSTHTEETKASSSRTILPAWSNRNGSTSLQGGPPTANSKALHELQEELQRLKAATNAEQKARQAETAELTEALRSITDTMKYQQQQILANNQDV